MFTILRGRVVDGTSTAAIENGLVIIEDEKIRYAGEYHTNLVTTLPKDSKTICLENGTILPGFIDCHVHLMQAATDDLTEEIFRNHDDHLLDTMHQMQYLVDAGFTSIREMSRFGPPLSRAVERSYVKGPRIWSSDGVICMTGGHCDFQKIFDKEGLNAASSMTYMADGITECLTAVRQRFRNGAKYIKIMATGGIATPGNSLDHIQFSPEEIRAMVEEAERHCTYVAAHCHSARGTYHALSNGVLSIEHGSALDDRCIELMVKNNAVLCPTLAAVALCEAYPLNPPDVKEKARRVHETHIEAIQKARTAGVFVVYGTDYTRSEKGQFGLNGIEFRYLVEEGGYTPMEAIQIATQHGARMLNMSDTLGTLESGKIADIVVVQGNPLDDITILEDRDNIKFVFQNGSMTKKTSIL